MACGSGGGSCGGLAVTLEAQVHVAHGSWPVAAGPWPLPHGPWPMAHGSWTMAHGSWPIGPWLMAHGPWHGWPRMGMAMAAMVPTVRTEPKWPSSLVASLAGAHCLGNSLGSCGAFLFRRQPMACGPCGESCGGLAVTLEAHGHAAHGPWPVAPGPWPLLHGHSGYGAYGTNRAEVAMLACGLACGGALLKQQPWVLRCLFIQATAHGLWPLLWVSW